MIWLLALALPVAALLAYVAADEVADLARYVARLVRDAVIGWLCAADDDPFDEAVHRCPICYDLDADEANGILRTDFDLWESEWTP